MAGESAQSKRRGPGESSNAGRPSGDNAPESAHAKRSRTGEHEPFDAQSCFSAGLFDKGGDLSSEFATAKPYRHISIAPFCNEELLQGVRQEMLTRLHFTQKETDIFKYHQSGDLANLDGLPEDERQQLPCLQRLRDAIYSQEFRDLVSRITGCGPLSGSRTDMSTNRYKQGDHLLLHDDVIGDRRVSYIIYLPDPEINDGAGWAPEDGGHLELYPRESPGSWAPAVSPTRRLPPQWNQIIIFTVLPGESHHSVEEVAGAGKERLSIQGWFHFPQPGEPGYHADQMQRLWQSGAVSTLGQIEAKRQRAAGCAGDDYSPYPDDMRAAQQQEQPEDPAGGSSSVLAEYINPDYLDSKIMRQVADRFSEDSHIQLADFLNVQTASALSEWLRATDAHDKAGSACAKAAHIPPHGTGERERWRAFGPPVVRRFLRLDAPLPSPGATADQLSPEPERSATALLAALRDRLFASPEFARWLARVTTLAVSAQRGMVRRFRPGLDYTLATPDGSTSTTMDAVLCLAHDPSRWADGVVGGYQCYIDSGDDGDDASNDGSVYRHVSGEDDGILLTTPAAWNTLTIALREPSVVKFVKYVSASAPGSRWDVSFEYAVDNDDSDDDSDSDNDDGKAIQPTN
ncbi:putative component of NuA3 histone acetyltransferase complex [Coemansia sp. RSA 1813]|nr:putative component of NuA3 histone acetyltransferase complex [Coemansia sp. RSA 1646]KAJ1772799.1 putative component of NuA3 histone acetyltransferase complex [Coemansia sp. RSA 1843]KAJ2088665.1 putative component of NuA3 histone acetyltransferase complex [Coemansia sp. RSA 986]KAJ2213130.1 putative component of NuA3 histone acetyltransferase complex [Coemansia sp. RSA 487]KAJ2568563.1 putative component of NuA3 histone acetyltransferase complex [Coemansia sp. RSA 1813]